MRKRIRWVGIAALSLFAAQACAGGQPGDGGGMRKPDAGRSDASVFDVIGHGAFGNYDPAMSLQELVQRSERIASGRFVDVWPGLVLELRVEKMLLGDPSPTLYVDFIEGNVETWGSEALPDERVLVFLREETWNNLKDSGPGGAPLYSIVTPQGLALDGDDGVEEVFEPMNYIYVSHPDFDELVQAVDAMVP
jgi:hypothetical protein